MIFGTTKKYLSSNIKKINKFGKLYPNGIIVYKVFLVYQEDKYMFGKIVSSKNCEEEIPFLFRSLDSAKDYVSICPQYKNVCICNNDYSSGVEYQTYKLSIGENEIGYIEWVDSCIHKSEEGCYISFTIDNDFPIIYKFVKNINIDSWENTWHVSDIDFDSRCDLISSLVKYKGNDKEKILEEYRYNLVQEQQSI